MSDNVKLTSTEGEMKQRLDKRLRNSGEGAGANATVKHGEGARRMYHNIHNSPSQGGAKRQNRQDDGSK